MLIVNTYAEDGRYAKANVKVNAKAWAMMSVVAFMATGMVLEIPRIACGGSVESHVHGHSIIYTICRRRIGDPMMVAFQSRLHML